MTLPPPRAAAPSCPSRRELQLVLGSGHTLVFINSIERTRVDALIEDVAASLRSQLYEWSLSRGMEPFAKRSQDGDENTRDVVDALRLILRTAQGGLYLMRDLHRFLDDGIVVSLLADIAARGTAILLVPGDGGEVPDELRVRSTVFHLPRPDHAMIRDRVSALLQQMEGRRRTINNLDADGHEQLIMSLRGLTLEEVDQVFTRLVIEDGQLCQDDIGRAIEAKGKVFTQNGVVELVSCEYGLDWVAGFHDFKRWAALRSRAWHNDAKDFGLDAPRGALLTGVPGCGKSFVVKALARDWNMPLLRMDAGALYDKFVGSTEANLRNALQTASSLAPCILWIDEIEKGFGTTGPSETDGGLSYRLVGTLATWMQERPAPVFIAATSNDITKLPPELTRQGRFDETFFVDLPTSEERQHLFALQIARRKRDYSDFNLPTLSSASEGFSGSEIEQAVTNALYAAFGNQRDLTTDDILLELAATRPLSRVSPTVVERIRAWGREHARAA